MKINIPQQYFSKLMRAVVEFDMIEDGDHILIGVSGGKDSIFLCSALAILRERLRKDFRLSALTIHPMFPDTPFDTARIRTFLAGLEIPYDVIDVDIAGAIEAQGGKTPCYTCAFFRRGAMNRYAKEHGFDYFTTTLTISPLKNAQLLNSIGVELAEKYGVPWLYSDFKKREGYKRSIVLSKEYDLYRQNYCGCVFSKRESVAAEN